MSQPVSAGPLVELGPGTRRVVTDGHTSVGVFNVNGTLVAYRNLCPHALAPICVGRVSGTTLPGPPGEFRWGRDGEVLACPWHGWEFDLTTGRAIADPRLRLRQYPVVVTESGDVLVEM